MITMRFANQEDLPGLLPLMTQLGYPCTPEELESCFHSFVKLDGYGVAVACDESKIVGWIAWSKSKPFVVNKTRFHLEGIVVDESCRGQGIGKKLMNFLKEVAQQSCPVIIDLCSGLIPLPLNNETIGRRSFGF